MKITIQLTPEQQRELRPIFNAVTEAMNRTSWDLSRDERGAVLGQCYSNGEADFYFLTKPQAKSVQRAIKKANVADTDFCANEK